MVMSSLASACCTWEATERTTVSTIMRTSKVPAEPELIIGDLHHTALWRHFQPRLFRRYKGKDGYSFQE